MKKIRLKIKKVSLLGGYRRFYFMNLYKYRLIFRHIRNISPPLLYNLNILPMSIFQSELIYEYISKQSDSYYLLVDILDETILQSFRISGAMEVKKNSQRRVFFVN